MRGRGRGFGVFLGRLLRRRSKAWHEGQMHSRGIVLDYRQHEQSRTLSMAFGQQKG